MEAVEMAGDAVGDEDMGLVEAHIVTQGVDDMEERVEVAEVAGAVGAAVVEVAVVGVAVVAVVIAAAVAEGVVAEPANFEQQLRRLVDLLGFR
jgi:hypothetical protein